MRIAIDSKCITIILAGRRSASRLDYATGPIAGRTQAREADMFGIPRRIDSACCAPHYVPAGHIRE